MLLFIGFALGLVAAAAIGLLPFTSDAQACTNWKGKTFDLRPPRDS